ncbi:hypothetical protein T05_13283 [Trichinella murrelli]|uniref:Uncharacterized protein n=1 Tax=Trichinella murrelli TaxID=144512 RepID=A0A0V0SZU5_9BILA|nr:hypothetical protein T05_13283 [Trichinella murrelli]
MLVNAECLITHIRWIYLEATSKCYNSNGAAEEIDIFIISSLFVTLTLNTRRDS